jgi:hypothetical protein
MKQESQLLSKNQTPEAATSGAQRDRKKGQNLLIQSENIIRSEQKKIKGFSSLPSERSTQSSNPDNHQEEEFVSVEQFLGLFGGETQWFRCFSDKRGGTGSKFDALNQFSKIKDRLHSLNDDGCGIFFIPNQTDGKGGADKNITGIRTVYIDLDGAPLQPVIETGLKPHAIIETSPGKWHVYWLVDGLQVKEFKAYQKELIRLFNSDKAVNNPSRVMRLPGFNHMKREPFMSRIIEFNPDIPKYSPGEIINGLRLDECQIRDESDVVLERQSFELPIVIPRGLRDTSIFKYICQLWEKGHTSDELLKMASVANTDHCTPPLPQSVIDEKVKRITGRYKQGTNKVAPDVSEPCKRNPTKFQKINACIREAKWEFFLDQSNDPYVYVPINGHYENIQINSSTFKKLLRKKMQETFDEGISNDAIQQVMGVIEGNLIHNPVKRSLYQRVAKIEGKILIDSGRTDWKVYEIDANGWRLTDPETNMFVRERKFQEYSCAENTPRVGWDEFFDILNITDSEIRNLLKIWLAVALIPDIPRPGLVVNGPPGSGKTTLTSVLRRIVDPCEKPVERFPANDIRSLELKLFQNHIPTFDNLNYINQESSDILCQVITGSLFDQRKLFTDSDTVSRYMKKPWILCGVSVPGTASDFLSRVFIVELGIISPERRRDEGAVKRDLEKLIPGLQALIFDCISDGLSNFNKVRTTGFQRLADSHRYSLAMCQYLQMSEPAIDALWKANKNSQDSETDSGNILTVLIPEFLGSCGGEWEGTATELHKALFDKFNPDRQSFKTQWPKQPNKLSGAINKIMETLVTKGVRVERKKVGPTRTIHLFLIPSDDTMTISDGREKFVVTDKILKTDINDDRDDNDDCFGKLSFLDNRRTGVC